jgi:hypothetical protein
MKSKLFASVLTATLLSIPAWAIQPTSRPNEEITAQRTLPQVNDALWAKLINCKLDYNEENGVYSIQLTPDVKALDGRTVTLRGFVLPMDGSDRTKHFLISRNTPVCMYCPPGQPNEVVEVRSSRAITWTSKVVAVTGKLSLVNDQEQAIFFKIQNAEVK